MIREHKSPKLIAKTRSKNKSQITDHKGQITKTSSECPNPKTDLKVQITKPDKKEEIETTKSQGRDHKVLYMDDLTP